LTYQFGLLVVNANPFSLAGSVTNLPDGSFPLGGLPRLTANTRRYSYVEPNPKRSYVEQWNFNVQRQLPGKIVLLIGYIGEHGVHQPYRTNDANMVMPTVSADGTLVWPTDPTARKNSKLLNPNVGVINAIAWQASNTYHGMNVGVTRQQKGLRVGLAYTWSKSIDNSSASIAGGTFTTDIQAPFLLFPQVFRGLSSFDVRHNLTFNFLWELPNKAFANVAVLKKVTSGWQLGGILHARSGLPFTVTTGGDSLGLKNANPFNFPDRVNTPACADPINRSNPDDYIRRECFSAPSPVTRLGNSSRNQLMGPAIKNFDLSVIKNNKLSERLNLQFRAEIFNIFNHANFAVPDRVSAQLFSFTECAPNDDNCRKRNNGSGSFSQLGPRRLNATSTTSRQIQFALKLTF
jgi:hypothetical protein